jgi:hypothetical protein
MLIHLFPSYTLYSIASQLHQHASMSRAVFKCPNSWSLIDIIYKQSTKNKNKTAFRDPQIPTHTLHCQSIIYIHFLVEYRLQHVHSYTHQNTYTTATYIIIHGAEIRSAAIVLHTLKYIHTSIKHTDCHTQQTRQKKVQTKKHSTSRETRLLPCMERHKLNILI